MCDNMIRGKPDSFELDFPLVLVVKNLVEMMVDFFQYMLMLC